MPISRRDFLEVSALSASGLLLTELPAWMSADGAVIPQGNPSASGSQRGVPGAEFGDRAQRQINSQECLLFRKVDTGSRQFNRPTGF